MQSTPTNLGVSHNHVRVSTIEDGPQTNLINHACSEERGTNFEGLAMRSLLLGDERVLVRDNFNTPPRVQRQHGLWELGESSVQPR